MQKNVNSSNKKSSINALSGGKCSMFLSSLFSDDPYVTVFNKIRFSGSSASCLFTPTHRLQHFWYHSILCADTIFNGHVSGTLCNTHVPQLL